MIGLAILGYVVLEGLQVGHIEQVLLLIRPATELAGAFSPGRHGFVQDVRHVQHLSFILRGRFL